MYYTNFQKKEFDSYLEYLQLSQTTKLKGAKSVYIDLDTLLFSGNLKLNQANHPYPIQDLLLKFNELLKTFSEIDAKTDREKQHRILRINLVDIKPTVDEDLFYWSYYSHKYTASKGVDIKALDEWHKFEDKLDVNKLAEFKARRETNLSLYLSIIKNHMYFNRIIFASNRKKDPLIGEFGFDVAEEIYLNKVIKDHHAQNICSISPSCLTSALFFLIKDIISDYKLKNLRASIVSNSKKLSSEIQLDLKSILHHLDIAETDSSNSDFIILINDLDLLTHIPELEKNKPLFIVDLSAPESPNFSYMLLKSDSFSEVFAYAKKRHKEAEYSAIIRALSAGLLSFARGSRFVDQIAVNYMDDYFSPLSTALNQPLKSFVNPISVLAQKLEDYNVKQQDS
jgi:hypothetical protein